MATPHGSPKILGRTIAVSTLVAVLVFVTDGLEGLLLLNLAVLPVVFILYALRHGHAQDISKNLYAEMFLSGGIISIVLASILEAAAQLRTLPVWRCEQSQFFTWQCDLAFILVVTIAVGLSEEFAKFAPLSRLKRNIRYLPSSNWFRVVETPIGMCLCGVASAAGFAAIENIKYVLKAGRSDFWYGVDTAALRSVLAIPFHVACTGYAAALYARQGYLIPEPQVEEPSTLWWWPRWRHQPQTVNAYSYHYITNGDSATEEPSPEMTPPRPVLVHEGGSILGFLSILTIPAIAHGVYDSGLFLTSQFFSAAGRAAERSRAIEQEFNLSSSLFPAEKWLESISYNSLSASTILPLADRLLARQKNVGILPGPSSPMEALREAESESGFYSALGVSSTGLALAAWAIMLGLFYREWRHLLKFQRAAIPMLHRHFDVP